MPGPKADHEGKGLTLRKFAKEFHIQRTECDQGLPVYIYVKDQGFDVYYLVESISISVHSETTAALVINAGEVSSVG